MINNNMDLGQLRTYAHNIIMNFLMEQGFMRSEASRKAWDQVKDAPIGLLRRTLAGYPLPEKRVL